jgi:hypothetical protein
MRQFFKAIFKNLFFRKKNFKDNGFLLNIFAWVDMHTMEKYLDEISDTHRYIVEELDLNHFVDKSIKHREIRVDLAADADLHGQKAHGGVKTNRNYGKLIYQKYTQLYC